MNMELDDEVIIRGIKQGTDRVIAAFYKEIAGGLLSHILKNNGSPEDLHDVFQIAYLRVKRQVDSGAYQAQGNFKGYFFSVARLYWYEELRRRKKSRAKEWDDSRTIIDDQAQLSEERIVHDQRLHWIHRGIKTLKSDDCREILTLRYLGRVAASFREIAEERGEITDGSSPKDIAKAESNTRVKHSRCLQQLKKLVAGFKK